MHIRADTIGASEGNMWQDWRVYGAYSIENYIKDEKGNILIDKVFRLEDIHQQLLPFLQGLGLKNLKPADIKHRNRRKNSKSYTAYYTEDTRAQVAMLYKYDIINFGYKFGE